MGRYFLAFDLSNGGVGWRAVLDPRAIVPIAETITMICGGSIHLVLWLSQYLSWTSDTQIGHAYYSQQELLVVDSPDRTRQTGGVMLSLCTQAFVKSAWTENKS